MRRIECRKCDSAYCDGCNIYILATMLKQGKLDCLMDEHHTITIDPEELRPKGEWEVANDGTHFCSRCGCDAPFTWDDIDRHFINSADDVPDRPANYCPNCGANMRSTRMEEQNAEILLR